MKNNNTLRLLLLLVSVLLSLTLLCSCQPSGTTPDDTTAGITDTTAGSTEETTGESLNEDLLSLVENGVCNFTLITPDSSSKTEKNVVSTIRKSIIALTGVEQVKLGTDWIRRGEEHDASAFEILIGQTNYNETAEVLNSTAYGAYSIRAVGNKIVITAWDNKSLMAAADRFVELMTGVLKENNIILAGNLNEAKVIDNTLNKFPTVPNAKISHSDNSYGCEQLIYSGVTETHFTDYCASLEAKGYTLYSDFSKGMVRTATYYNDEYTLNVVFEGYYKELNVILENYSEKKLPPKEQSYTKVCDTLLAQVGVEYKYSSDDAPQNGMCYVWRLEDGTFIILDGGFNYTLGADNLYKVLQKLSPNGQKPVVAAWLFSHFHSDHVGTFMKFASNYKTKFTLKSVIFHLPSEEAFKKINSSWSAWNTIKPLVNYFGATIYIAHPGQTYHFANAKIDILYTMEMYSPAEFTYYNTSTVVFDVQFGEFNMVMLGDTSEYSNPYIRNNYGTSLESEVVQVAHHGYDGGSWELYERINPLYVLWPVGNNNYYSMQTNGKEDPSNRNAYFFSSGTRIKQIFQAGSTVAILYIEKDTGFTSYERYESIEKYVEGVKMPANLAR